MPFAAFTLLDRIACKRQHGCCKTTTHAAPQKHVCCNAVFCLLWHDVNISNQRHGRIKTVKGFRLMRCAKTKWLMICFCHHRVNSPLWKKPKKQAICLWLQICDAVCSHLCTFQANNMIFVERFIAVIGSAVFQTQWMSTTLFFLVNAPFNLCSNLRCCTWTQAVAAHAWSKYSL